MMAQPFGRGALCNADERKGMGDDRGTDRAIRECRAHRARRACGRCALYFLKPILVPIALALLLASMLSPITGLVRKILPISATGAALLLFVFVAVLGLYMASLTTQTLMEAADTLPSDVERLAGRLSARVSSISRDYPYLRPILPEPGTIDLLGDANRNLLIGKLRYGLGDLMSVIAQGFIVLVLVLFLLARARCSPEDHSLLRPDKP